MGDFKMEDIRQTEEWARYLQSCGWVVEKVKGINVFIKKIPLTPFSMMKVQRFRMELLTDPGHSEPGEESRRETPHYNACARSFDSAKAPLRMTKMEGFLKEVKRKYRVVYMVVEPGVNHPLRIAESSEPSFAGWRVNTKPFLPTKTVVVDLGKSKKQLWSDLSTNTKRILRKEDYTSEQIIFRKNDSSDEKSRIEFYKAWKRSSKTWVMSKERFNKLLDAFGKKASLWVSEGKGELLSGILVLESGDTANYFQTWTSERGRVSGAHYYLVWQVILACKKKGLKWFDFEGVLDERWPMKKWAGFSEFKRKFGGKVVAYPGSFTKWF